MPAAEILHGRRIVSSVSTIDSAVFPLRALLLRFAPDDVLVVGDGPIDLADQHAIVEDDHGWCALSVREDRVLEVLARHAAWAPPFDRPALAQGMIAGLAAKVLLDGDRSLIIVAAPFAHELEERLI